MKADLLIKNARVIDHQAEFFGGIAVKDGKILMVCDNSALPAADREIDAQGRCLLPGIVDPHCHLGVAFPFDEDMRTESAQAARGGITTIFLYIRNLEASYIPFYKERREIAEGESCIDFGFHFGIQREEHINEIPKIVAATGVQSFKLYFGYEVDNPIGIVPASDGWVYATMMQVAKLPKGVVSVHCENTAIAGWIRKEIEATGRQDLAAYTESRPAFCEEETIKRMIFLAERTACTLQVVHTSVAAGPVLGAQARAKGLDVTIETCPHYLIRTCYDEDLDMRAKISPPLRDKTEKEGLWKAMLNDEIGNIGSDHVPFFPKKGVDVWTEKPGVVSFPWELPLLITEGVINRGMTMQQLVNVNSFGPAKRFGIYPSKGSLEVGTDADMVLVDMDQERSVHHPDDGKGYCIYEGMKLKGWPVMTISNGQVICENDEVTDAAFGTGRCITRPGY